MLRYQPWEYTKYSLRLLPCMTQFCLENLFKSVLSVNRIKAEIVNHGPFFKIFLFSFLRFNTLTINQFKQAEKYWAITEMIDLLYPFPTGCHCSFPCQLLSQIVPSRGKSLVYSAITCTVQKATDSFWLPGEDQENEDGFLQMSGISCDQGSSSSRKEKSLLSMCLVISESKNFRYS